MYVNLRHIIYGVIILRKTKKDAEQTKALILKVALNIFSEKSYEISTLNDIASAAGLTRGAIYWHFKDKNDILKELTTIHLIEFLNKLNFQLYIEGEDSLKTIKKLFDLYFEHFLDNESNMKFKKIIDGKMSFNENNPFVLEIFKEIIDKLLYDLNQTIIYGQGRNEIRKDIDATFLTTTIISLLMGLDKIMNLNKHYENILNNREKFIQDTLAILKG